MFIEKLSPKEKKYFWIVMVLLSIAILDRFVLRKVWDEYKNIDDEASLIETKIRKNLFILSQSKRIDNEYKQFSGYFQEKIKSDEEEISKMLSMIEEKAKTAGISVNNMKPYPVKNVKSGKSYLIEIEAETVIDSLIKFIHDIESSKEIFKVEKIELSVRDEGKSNFKVFMQITRIAIAD